MDSDQYFEMLKKQYEEASRVASEAKAMGFDPEPFIEIKAAPDIASRVEGIIGYEGLAEIIKRKAEGGKPERELAFDIVKEICTDKRFEMEKQKRLTLAVRVGLSILTQGVLVAPTEGIQGVELHKNADGTDYIAVLYAGPIRGAGGTDAALSVALADHARKLMGIGAYKASQTEVVRYIEEMLLYDARCARLQYKPPEEDMKLILENLPVCVDGVPTEQIEVSVHRNVKRLDASGQEQMYTNIVRGGVALVICEGIAQKAKSVIKYAKMAGLDWSWLNGVIRVDKGTVPATQLQVDKKEEKKEAVFLQELLAGRPVLAYPGYPGSFRLRYGRSRMTGIAAKGFSPATMHILDEFIAVGTQLKVEKPGKGCIATPVDSIEGPFVKLKSGEALRINTAEQAKALKGSIAKILSVGDILITFGDFKKTNTPLPPTSYVEEYWLAQLRGAGYDGPSETPSFREAYLLSKKYGVPMHPRYIYDYSDVNGGALDLVAKSIMNGAVRGTGDSLFDIEEVEIPVANEELRDAVERICIPHVDNKDTIKVSGGDAQSLVASLGFTKDERLNLEYNAMSQADLTKEPVEILNSFSPFKIMKRATRIGARIGRPEKARERLMKPAPHVLFPIGERGGKERNIFKAYSESKRSFDPAMEIEIARYKCPVGKEFVTSPYCSLHNTRAELERICKACGRYSTKDTCAFCKSKTQGYDTIKVQLAVEIDAAMKRVGEQSLPKVLKGVRGLVSKDKIAEPIEKGILRAAHGVYIFKDGTSRWDATDTPITHFYPSEVSVSVEKLRELGYTEDYMGNELRSDDQLVELRHQDVILNTRAADYLVKVAKFMDGLLVKFYNLQPFYKAESPEDLLGHCVVTLSPHTSCGVLGRIVGFTSANVGFAHPYTISARRRNCDGDEDTTMLLLDALVNFSRRYLPTTIGGTMDAPLVLSVNIHPDEVDDEVHAMEVVDAYGIDFYNKTFNYPPPGEMSVELVGSRLKKKEVYSNVRFTHATGPRAVADSPKRSTYTTLKTMQEKLDKQFELMDMLYTIDKSDTARRLIISHFIPDLIGNLHSFSKQTFRCVSCNAKYRRVPLVGHCTRLRCGGKLVLTISKGGIEKYLNTAIALADRYNIEPYIKQRLMLVKEEIEAIFGQVGGGEIPTKQFNLANYM